MLKSDIKEMFDVLGITAYHEVGITGKGVKFLEAESEGTKHCGHWKKAFKMIAPDVELHYAPTSDMKALANYVLDNDIAFVGASISGSKKDWVYWNQLKDAGVTLFTSAGNNNKEVDSGCYAYYDIFISVGACNWNKDYSRIRKKNYSNFGTTVDLTAPQYYTIPGTSFTVCLPEAMCCLFAQNYGYDYNFYDLLTKYVIDLPRFDYGIFSLVEAEKAKGGDRMAHQEFIKALEPIALEGFIKHGILPSLTIAQACLESGFGVHHMGDANNYFGFKATSSWDGPTTLRWTSEWDGSSMIRVQAPFRAYSDMNASIRDYQSLLGRLSRYKDVLGQTDYVSACKAVADGGYATDPKYASKLIQIIEEYKLYELDTLPSDISEWAKEAMDFMTNIGVTDGTRPKDFITREENVTMLHRLYKFMTK